MADLSVSVLISAVDRITAPLRAIMQGTGRLSSSLSSTQDILSRLSGAAGQTQNYERLERRLEMTSRQLEQSRQRTAELGRAISQTQNPTDEMIQQFEQARARTRALQEQHQRQRLELQRLRQELDRTSDSTSELTEEQEDLEDQTSDTNERLNEQIRRLRSLGSAASGVKKNLANVASSAGSLATKVTGGAVALTAAVGLINSSTTEKDLLAKSVNADVSTVENIASSVKAAGFEFDNVINLFEEMNNKLGESAGIEELTPVKESLSILGLEYRNLQDLAPEEQFKAITNAALKMADSQQAAAAMDILMGGEANKMLGVLRQRGGTIEDIIAAQQKLNFATVDSRKGASLFTESFGKTQKIIASLSVHIAGLAGKYLAPLIDKLNDFVVANKDLINTKINEFFVNITAKASSMGSTVKSISAIFDKFSAAISFVTRMFGSFENMVIAISVVIAGKLILAIASLGASIVTMGIAAAPVFASMIASAYGFAAAMLANPITWIVAGVIAGVAALAAAAYAIYKNWGAISDFFSNMWAGIKATFASGVVFILEKIQGLVSVMPDWALPESLEADNLQATIDKYKQLSEPVYKSMPTLGDSKADIGMGAPEQASNVVPLGVGQRTDNSIHNTQVTINVPEGANAKDIAAEFEKFMQQRERQQQSQQRAAMYDY